MCLKTVFNNKMSGTLFESIGAAIKGNYKMTLITSKHKCTVLTWIKDTKVKGTTS